MSRSRSQQLRRWWSETMLAPWYIQERKGWLFEFVAILALNVGLARSRGKTRAEEAGKAMEAIANILLQVISCPLEVRKEAEEHERKLAEIRQSEGVVSAAESARRQREEHERGTPYEQEVDAERVNRFALKLIRIYGGLDLELAIKAKILELQASLDPPIALDAWPNFWDRMQAVFFDLKLEE